MNILMFNSNAIPRQFQVLSVEPELRIRFIYQMPHRVCYSIFVLPFLMLFMEHCWMLLLGIYNIATLRVWQGFHILSYGEENIGHLFLFFFTFFLLGMVAWSWVWVILGVTKFHASPESLCIYHQVLGLSRKITILAKDIEYFNQYFIQRFEGDTWDLEVVTNLKLSNRVRLLPAWYPRKGDLDEEACFVRMNLKTIHIFEYGDPHLRRLP